MASEFNGFPILKGVPTPYLTLSTSAIATRARSVGRGIPNCSAYYAVKANDFAGIIGLLAPLDIGFEVATLAELDAVLGLGVPPWRVITGSPVKTVELIEGAFRRGVRQFAFDCTDEVDKLAAIAPGCDVVIRINVPNDASDWPLSGKFGADDADVLPLMTYARDRGLNPAGTTFHVGSQCNSPASWAKALEKCSGFWKAAAEVGIQFSVLNMGGGYPSRYLTDVPPVEAIESVIADGVRKWYPKGIRTQIEPGRYLVGDAGTFVTRCVARAVRDGKDWLFLDVGVFNGLMEAVAGIRYRFSVPEGGPVKTWSIGGPSCDGFDVVDKNVELPEPTVGGLVLIHTAGAYTSVYASNFNGFPIPRIVMVP
jgi:ornithine decarboxylase